VVTTKIRILVVCILGTGHNTSIGVCEIRIKINVCFYGL
jgi:hypothetical protein